MSPKRVTKPLDIYVRVSDVRGRAGDSFISPAEQEERCRAFAVSRGYEVGEVLTDLDVSGGSMDRPQFNVALERVREGISGGILTAKLDRFSRTLEGAIGTLREINEAGAAFISVDGDFDTSTWQGEMVLNILLSIAQGERGRIKANWNDAQRRAVERGIHISRHEPPGYERDGNGKLVPHPKHGKTITRAFELAAAGSSYSEIARYLNERQLTSAGKKTAWASNRIKRLLANRVYLGEARYGEMTNAEAHPPLTDEATWLLAQRENRAPSLSADSSYLLTGLVRCAGCRHAMKAQKARGKTVAVYRCPKHHPEGPCPQPSTISMDRLDDYILSEFSAFLLSKPDSPQARLEDPALRFALEEAQAKLEGVLADEEKLREYGVFEQARDAAVERIEQTKQALSSPLLLDTENVAEEMLLAAQLRAGERPLGLLDEEGRRMMRSILAKEIRAVFVRPAASRSHSLPIGDRVRIVWRDDQPLELPKRGERYQPRAYAWV